MCTWKECGKSGAHLQHDKHGKPWANLCDEHHRALEDALQNGNPKAIMSAYVKAQGGAKAAAARMMKTDS